MTTPERIAETPLPPCIRRFAPWTWLAHWRPWKRWTLVVGTLLLGYVLSPIVVVPVLNRSLIAPISPAAPNSPPLVMWVVGEMYLPIGWAADNIPAVQWFYDTSFDAVDAAINAVVGREPGPVYYDSQPPPTVPAQPPYMPPPPRATPLTEP